MSDDDYLALRVATVISTHRGDTTWEQETDWMRRDLLNDARAVLADLRLDYAIVPLPPPDPGRDGARRTAASALLAASETAERSEKCSHDSLHGDEDSTSGRMPTRWRCDECNAQVQLRTTDD